MRDRGAAKKKGRVLRRGLFSGQPVHPRNVNRPPASLPLATPELRARVGSRTVRHGLLHLLQRRKKVRDTKRFLFVSPATRPGPLIFSQQRACREWLMFYFSIA